jgi:flagellin
MSFSVNTNAGALTALQNLSASSRSLDVTQSRVNTGLKVASAKDDAATFSIAQKLRGDLAGLSAVNNSLNRALSEVDVSIAAAEAVSDLLIELRELAVAGSDEGLDADSRTSLNDKFTNVRDQITSIVDNAEFNGRNALNGDDSIQAITDAAGSSTISQASNDLSLSGLNLDGANLVTAPGASVSGTIVSLAGQSIDAASDTDFRDALINLENDNGGDIGGENLNFASGTTTNNDGEPFDSDYGRGVFAALGTDVSDQAVSVRLDGAASPFSITFQAGSTIFLVRDGSDSFLSLGDPSASVGSAETTEASDDALAKIEAAISSVNGVLSELGATSNRLELQQTFAGKLADSVNVGIGNLVDADLAKESAALQAIQTRQQLGLQALSIANQAPQSVLSLFR